MYDVLISSTYIHHLIGTIEEKQQPTHTRCPQGTYCLYERFIMFPMYILSLGIYLTTLQVSPFHLYIDIHSLPPTYHRSKPSLTLIIKIRPMHMAIRYTLPRYPLKLSPEMVHRITYQSLAQCPIIIGELCGCICRAVGKASCFFPGSRL